MDRHYQIFISSTFTDLKDERKALFEAILNAKHFPAGMESFPASNDEQFKYMLLNRLQTDCKYYLGYGNGNERHLWGETVEMHIEYMYIIYDSLKIKPEWLTEQQIKVYSDLMLQIKNDKNF